MDMEMDKVIRARIKLLLGKDGNAVFFATLAMRLKLRREEGIGTMATDGEWLLFEPSFVDSLEPDVLVGVVAHEVMHCVLGHMSRRKNRDPMLWNIAADLAIHEIIIPAGYKLPSGACIVGRGPFRDFPKNKSADQYYELLLQNPEKVQMLPSGDDPGGCGKIIDSGKPNAAEADWKNATVEAHAVAKQKGNMSGGISELVEELLEPKVDWREVLRQFVSTKAKNDYSFFPPSRRHVWRGAYLPSCESEEVGDIAVAFDTSGSISSEQLQRFASEIQGILEAFTCRVVIMYHDSEVKHIQEWESTDGPIKTEITGRGGTCHRPVFKKLDEYPECKAVVCLTDLYTSFPEKTPDMPVLWCVVGNNSPEAPFGDILKCE